jgi:hypothetical protein
VIAQQGGIAQVNGKAAQMKRTLKALLIAASLAATAQTAGAQTAPPPLAGCTVQTVNGTRNWVCPIGTFLVPSPAPTVAATAAPTVAPVAGLNLLPGMVIPQTAGSTFSILTSMSVGIINPSRQIITRSLKSDVQANLPNASGGTTSQSVVGLAIMSNTFIVAFSNANLATLRLDMPQFQAQLFPTLRAVNVTYTTYVFQNGKWTAGSSQKASIGPSTGQLGINDLSSTMTPARTGGLNAYQIY